MGRIEEAPGASTGGWGWPQCGLDRQACGVHENHNCWDLISLLKHIYSLPIIWNSSTSLAWLSALAFVFFTCKQLADAFQEMILSLAHLDRVTAVISGDILTSLAASDRFNGDLDLDSGLLLGTCTLVGAQFRSCAPPQGLTMRAEQKNQST